jgi:Ser/Thr protein kinase RdoA (MazF antagonist)|tara:strand:+ start:986 stop:1927 length:942 start_codon:yes stop_codon:yes gene_type:complete
LGRETDTAKRALALYGVKGNLRRVASGLDNTYRVVGVDQRLFALRVSSGISIRNKSAFHIEASWMVSLRDESDVRAPKPQHTRDGKLVGEVQHADGERRATMMLEWIPGRRSRHHVTTSHAYALGRVAATLHKTTRGKEFWKTNDIIAWNVERICGDVIENTLLTEMFPEITDLVDNIGAHVAEAIAGISPNAIGLINADLGMHNVLWHKSGPGLVDFNDSGIGPYAFCLARLRARLSHRENGADLSSALMNGYRKVSKLPDGISECEGIFDLAADLFAARYAAAKAARGGNLTPLLARQLFLGFLPRVERLG